ncbi:MAG TPA: hypothetical protein DEA90_07710 [Opitutae bacterium]|nr:hypothetical protein [Opitutae bacterium]
MPATTSTKTALSDELKEERSYTFALGLDYSPQFFVVDLGISKKFEFESYDLTLRAGINNVFDAYQDDQESGFERDPGYVYGPRTPRTFILGARIDF